MAQFPAAAPSAVGMSATQLAYIRDAVETEIAHKQLPGAVVLVARQGKVVWRRAYGQRALEPRTEPMTVDTIFDLASLTKVVATATSVMILVERGQVRLGDPVARYIPEFAEMGKRNITVEQLMTHRSGFMPDNDIKDYEQGPQKAFENIWRLAPIAEAGSRFIYSDINYIVLAELVRRVSGKPLDEFASDNIFRPLGMKDTGFKPAARLQPRMAPTEKRGEHWMRGEVHDPRAYLLGGVAGHAGVFSTADDLAVYCQMILGRGEYHGVRVLSPMGVARMTEARASGGNASDGNARGLGWDVATGYSSNRGDLFPVGSFGHTGFTGTSIWIDPASETFVIFLSNRVHPRVDPKQPADVNSLRGRIASIVAASIIAPPYRDAGTRGRTDVETAAPPAVQPGTQPPQASLNGIDVLARDGFALLKGRRVGLITNQTGRDREGRSTIDLLHQAPGVKLVALFSPEHGIRGVIDEKVADSVDEKTGLPIYSLYGETRKPTREMLKDLDTLVYDIQDVGARFYTYISTLGLAMEEAAKNKIRFVVLDRVNPIGGVKVEGPLADADKLSFTAYHELPIRHGMTVGELARLFNRERKIDADLQVVQVENWRRESWFDETGLVWINPSPNMRSLTEATLYPGIGLLETTNVSVGRGTETPFEVVGAPWIDGRRLAAGLNGARLTGVRFVPVRFTPRASVHKDAECGGINIVITDRAQFEPITTGLEIAAQLLKMYPKDFAADKFRGLLVNQKVHDAFLQGADGRAMLQVWESDLAGFRVIRAGYLLY
ncbi:MAG TPA: exo-beta-N-acetylmuramidase NamZ domain-containing protein [Terriglobia bacterium]|nr:exo-beta-N-acetylmuramidase NamZ domain-containing protein [Terriglobia bacterium]